MPPVRKTTVSFSVRILWRQGRVGWRDAMNTLTPTAETDHSDPGMGMFMSLRILCNAC